MEKSKNTVLLTVEDLDKGVVTVKSELLFTHRNVKDGNIDFLRKGKEFYSKFAEWVTRVIELPDTYKNPINKRRRKQ